MTPVLLEGLVFGVSSRSGGIGWYIFEAHTVNLWGMQR